MEKKLKDKDKIILDSNMVFMNCLVITAYLLVCFSSIGLALKLKSKKGFGYEI